MSFRTRSLRISIAALTVLGATACASVTTQDASALPRAPTLTVQNRAWEDMTLYLVRGSMSVRIGKVEGLSSKEIAIPAALFGSGIGMRIEGRVHHGPARFTTDLFDLRPNMSPRLVIEHLTSLTYLMVR